MTIAHTKTLRKGLTWIVFLLLLLSVVVWYITRDALPRRIAIATAMPGGLYREFATHLKKQIAQQTGRDVELEESRGSVDNRRRLLSEDPAKRTDLAIVQAGAVSLDGLAVIAPLYREVVHVIVRKDRGIASLRDLDGKKVVLGPRESGMRSSAMSIVQHYQLDVDHEGPHSGLYFAELLNDASLDAAIVTSGMRSPDLRKVLGDGRFGLLPIDDAAALETTHAHFRRVEIPRGLYAERTPVPSAPVRTVATTALLVARQGASDALVAEVLRSLYESDLGLEFPPLIACQAAADWAPMRLHPVARRYLYPYDEMGRLANIMESMAAVKELLFALAAAIYLLWDRWRRLKEKENQERLSAQKEYLDRLLERTMRIETAQMDTKDLRQLERFLDEVTRIKLQALTELTHESLRGDRTFAIFLMQCANLINKIQLKIMHYAAQTPPQGTS